MFGQNPLRKQERGDGLSLSVHSVFGTIQGEGPFSGRPAIFVRLAGCNLQCFFCDTDFETGASTVTLDALFGLIEEERKRVKTYLIVLTGGEPLRQPVGPFIDELICRGMHVQIETAGTVWPASKDDWLNDPGWYVNDEGPAPITIVCSPKTGKVHPKIEMYCRDWKYIIAMGECDTGDGLPVFSTQREGNLMTVYRASHGTIWLQPREDYFKGDVGMLPDPVATRANMQLASEIAMRFGYRLTLQTHKILGLP